jgi:hypothetical protein
MPDQSAEAIPNTVDSGISAIELMGGRSATMPEAFGFTPSAGGRRGGAAVGGRTGGRGGRGAAGAGAAAAAAPDSATPMDMSRSWNGQPAGWSRRRGAPGPGVAPRQAPPGP